MPRSVEDCQTVLDTWQKSPAVTAYVLHGAFIAKGCVQKLKAIVGTQPSMHDERRRKQTLRLKLIKVFTAIAMQLGMSIFAKASG